MGIICRMLGFYLSSMSRFPKFSVARMKIGFGVFGLDAYSSCIFFFYKV
jgi:hypothetical protein